MIFWALVFAADMLAGDVWEKEPKRRRRKDAMVAVLEVVTREGSFRIFWCLKLGWWMGWREEAQVLCIEGTDGDGRGWLR